MGVGRPARRAGARTRHGHRHASPPHALPAVSTPQISADIAQLQQEAEATTATANAEKAELDGELVRLTSLVATFQASIAQFLPGLSMGGC